MKICVSLIPFVLLGMLSAAEQDNNRVIVPGVRVGPVTATTVKADLPRLFPHTTIEEQELELDEGMVFPATLIARATPGQSLAIVWTGKGADAHPKQVYVCRGRRRGPCEYHVPVPGGDIAVGTRFSELEKLNGKTFTIQGFGWGYGGTVLSWDGGKMEKADCGSSLSLAIDGERDRDGDLKGDLTEAERGTFTGNRPVSSDTPALEKLNPSVTEILVRFGEGTAKPCAR